MSPESGRFYVEVWARKIGMSYQEMMCRPIGEVNDLISAYQIIMGNAEEEETSIPKLR